MTVFNVSITVEGPLLTRDSRAASRGVDAASLRDTEARYIIPGTLIKGRLKEAWMDIEEALDAASAQHRASALNHLSLRREAWLGEGADQNKLLGKGDPHGSQGLLRFGDLAAQGAGVPSRQVRAPLDKDRLAAEDRMLMELEAAGAPGSEITFTGTIDADIPDAEAENARRAIEAGLRWVSSLGALGGVGFGAVSQATVTPATPAAPGHTGVMRGHRLEVALAADRPLCVMGHVPVHQNLFESLGFLPGNVLKGAIAASALRLAGLHGQRTLSEAVLRQHGVADAPLLALARHFPMLRVRHALPGAVDGPRPRALPLSLLRLDAAATDDRCHDAALLDGPVLIGDRAPAFAPDWKDASAIRRRFGWVETRRDVRVRTAIDRTSRRADKGKLFAYDRVSLDRMAAWKGVIDLSAISASEERGLVTAALRVVVAAGIGPVGKSKAFLHALPASGEPTVLDRADDNVFGETESPARHDARAVWVVVLQSEALLGSPEVFAGQGALAMYRAVFDALSERSLRVKRFFAQQVLTGGDWLHERFRAARSKMYSPYLLTTGGSVFVLESDAGEAERAQKFVDDWHGLGLPIDAGAQAFYGLDVSRPLWEQCPFVRENGFGEVAVDQPLHEAWKPRSTHHVEAL